jgi:hypothetical protein
MLLRHTDVPEGRIRTRVLGEPRDDRPPVVVVQGMAVSDYLAHWRLDARTPSPGLQASHVPEWRRAGGRGVAHLVRVHLGGLSPRVRTARVPGAHAFVWNHPGAWAAPLQELADRAAGGET